MLADRNNSSLTRILCPQTERTVHQQRPYSRQLAVRVRALPGPAARSGLRIAGRYVQENGVCPTNRLLGRPFSPRIDSIARFAGPHGFADEFLSFMDLVNHAG